MQQQAIFIIARRRRSRSTKLAIYLPYEQAPSGQVILFICNGRRQHNGNNNGTETKN